MESAVGSSDWRLIKFVAGPLNTNVYLLVTPDDEAVLIDAAPQSFKHVVNFLRKERITLKCILLTHGHFDHVSDSNRIRAATGAEVVMHEADLHILDISRNVASAYGVDWEDPQVTKYLRIDSENIDCLTALRVVALHTPGHTPGSLCYYLPEIRVLFTGDTLFKGTVGATHFPGGSHEDMITSIRKLMRLPKETMVFPGHGPSSSIGEELENNPFVLKFVLR